MQLFLRFLRTYAAPYWSWYLLGFFALYGSNQLTVLVPVYIKDAIDALSHGDQSGSLHKVYVIMAAAIGIMLIRTLSRACFFNPGRTVEFRIKNHLFAHLMSLPQSFHDTAKVGDLMSRATNDLQNVRALIGFAGLQLIEGAFIIPLTMHQMLKLDQSLTLSNAGLLLIAMLILYGAATVVVTLMRQNLEQLAHLSEHVLDTYSAIPVVQGFVAWPAFHARFDGLNDAYVNNGLKISAIRSFFMPLVNLIGQLCVGLVLWRGGQDVLEGNLSVGSLVAYSGFIGILVSKMMSLGWTLSVIQRGSVALKRVYELLETPPNLPPVKAALPAPVSLTGAPALSLVTGTDTRSVGAGERGYRIEVRGLTFGYKDEAERGPVLQDISFTLEPGQTLGVFGPTGSGKSTLVHLLARIYTPPAGTIFLNGVDINDVPLEGLREELALVPQDPFLFSTTLRGNIAWGGQEESPEPARLDKAISLACLDGDIKALTQGLDTIVGARGVTLSGGQRQRTALARAFYRPFHILLLDDVLAAVDHRTERQLIQNIYAREQETASLSKGASAGQLLQTTVIISHRISALQHADTILVLDGGRVVAKGTHDALIRQPGIYAECWQKQQERGDEDG